ncbi:transporter [Comamonas sp. AG1104]|uniref:SphA family protein n=1 Tax=Comamonas sp. AG1104 TaxID=2183900 RepID=UPI000E0A7F66|nr:transporter [Comamonas sp. AG1104]RDI04652.1 hypothetical protein DFO48_1162 [Comamonas sp. AG1104]
MDKSIHLLICASVIGAASANAAEGGGSVYPNGAENFVAGALPPPGIYGIAFVNHYEANRLNDFSGKQIDIPGFKVRATAITPRVIWVPGVSVLGGDLVAHMLAPLVEVEAKMGGQSQKKSGLGDITMGLGVGHHHGSNLHTILGLDVTLPTGSYRNGDLANLGRNYSALEPVLAVSYLNSQGFNGDLRMGYLINRVNKATDYRSGQEFHLDYAAGWGLGNGWVLGLGGYYRKQTQLDKQMGVELSNSKTSGMAIGPSIKYDSGRGWFLTAKWQFEKNMKNSAQGNALWLRAALPL